MDLGYINARVRAWRGDLFKESDYNELMSSDSVNGLIEKLKGSRYRFDLGEARARFGDEGGLTVLENGLKGNLFRTLKEVWDDSPSDIRILIKVIVSFWEVYNLKTVIRGIHSGISLDKIYSILIPVGDLDESALRELSQQKDVRFVVQILDTWDSPYGKPLREVLPDYQKKKEIINMELSLDHFVYSYYNQLLYKNDINTSMVNELMRDRIDALNIITLFKFLKGKGSYPISNYYISGGKRLTEEDFIFMGICRNEDELLNGLISRIKNADWKEKLEMLDPDEPSMIEEKMESLIGKNFCDRGIVSPLSIAVIICFYYMKIQEIKNLRLIGIGKEYSIPADDVKKYLLKG